MKQPELGKKIAEYRNECGLTQEQLNETLTTSNKQMDRITKSLLNFLRAHPSDNIQISRDGEIGFAVPVGVVDRKFDVGVALPRELDDALDVVVGDVILAREPDLALERRVLLGLEAVVARALAVDTGFQDGAQVLLVDF